MQTKFSADNAEVIEEICKSDSKFDIMSDLIMIKKMNSELSSRLVNIQRQCWANNQYSRMECSYSERD